MKNYTNKPTTPELLLRHGYRYIELIGEGSNGKTYLSKSLKTGEIVAIKALKFSDNLKNYELFKREAETLKSIHTPGTPRFYDYITDEGEFTECWLVQEYIKGESLLDKINNTNYECVINNEIKTLELIFETAKIIHTLQTSYVPPIIHRDIKPSNILLREQAKDGTNLCLIDFGAVANPQKRGLNSTVAGTVGYMAPEQLIGDCAIQSDYYALGATALHMMTGINPSEFPTDGFTLQFEETLIQHMPNVHQETIDLLHKLLATNAHERPKDAQELLKSISKVLISINSTAMMAEIKARNNLIKETRYGISPGHNAISIFLITLTLLLLLYFNFAYPKLYILKFIFIMVVIILGGVVGTRNSNQESRNASIKKLNTELWSLPDYSPEVLEIQKYAVFEEETDLSDSEEAMGEIVRIIDNIIEYVVAIGHEYYTAYYQDEGIHSYKLGDKIRVKYVKKFGKYRFYDVKPE